MTESSAAQDALSAAEPRLRERFGNRLSISDWSELTDEHIWSPDYQGWETITRYPHRPSPIEIAVWWGHELAALAVARAFPDHISLDHVGAPPAAPPPLKGQRFAIVLAIVTEYAQKMGCLEIRLSTENEHLRAYCIETADFQEQTDRTLVKRVEVKA